MHPEHSTPRGQGHGQYVEYDQRGSTGHHLQRLENSVDRFLPQSSPHSQSSAHTHMQSSPHPHMQSSPHPHMQSSPHPHMQSSPHPHMQSSPHVQGRFKLSPLPSPQHQDMRGGGTQDRHPGMPRSSPLLQPPESPNHRAAPSNLHAVQSPVGGYQGTLPVLPTSQQPSHLRTVSASPNNAYQSVSPGGHRRPESPPTPQQYGVQYKQPDPAAGSSYQRPSSRGPEQDSRTTPSAVQPPRPQNSESPDDQDAHRLGVSKHEPIQNIIGSHPPSDILYLICRLCRQTYGSPYGFRKHFRNQHGFEPKAEHTIVQTISATKTAMAHTGPLDHHAHSAPLDHMDKVMLSESPFEDGNVYEEGQYHSHRRDKNNSFVSQSATNPFAYDDVNKDVKRDVQENKLLECPECGHTFQLNDFGSYKRHCRQHSLHRNSGPFACHDCQKSFPEPGLLQEHLDTHSSFTASECGICRTFFSSPNYLAEHLQASHGHVYHADGGDKDSQDNPRRSSEDHPQKFESSESGNIKRSSSFSGTSAIPPPGSHARSPLPPGSHSRSPLPPGSHARSPLPPGSHARSPLPPGPNYSPTTASPAAPMGHSLPLSKRHRQFSTADPLMFTVHTPKGLEVQKLPADAVVTTASPDSSYDEAKVDPQPSNSGSQNVGTSEDVNMRETDAAREKTHPESSISSKSAGLTKAPSSEGQKSVMKDETESNSSDCCLSVESNSQSVGGSRASSPGLEDVEKFYKHKKYSRHRKRVNSEDLNESESKASKVEGSNSSRNDQSPFSVSSSINSGVTFRDCESSGQLSEDSNNSLKSRGEDSRKRGDKLATGQEKNGTDHPGSKSKGSDFDDKKFEDLSKKPGDSGNKFKWDRLTRSQAGKASQSVSYTSS